MKGFIRKNIIGLCRLRTILVSLLFFFTLFTAKAIAVDYYWTATDDGSVKNWSHSQNWSNHPAILLAAILTVLMIMRYSRCCGRCVGRCLRENRETYN